MFEDARKTSDHEADFEVVDLAELVAEAIDLKNIDLKHVPSLVERITDAASTRVADVIVNQLAEKLADQVADAVAKKLGPGAIAVNAAPADTAAPAAAPAEAKAPTAVAALGAWGGNPITPAVLPGYDIPSKNGPRIMVAVKEIGTLGDEFAFTDDGRDVKEEFFDFILNEWDDTALEAALQTIEKLGSGEVIVVTVGPERAETTLRKVMAKGAHRGVRVWDDSLAGADPVSVARALAGVAKLEEADLILTGAQSADQAQGATGTALARILGIPHTAVVLEMDWDGAGSLKVMRELEGGMGHAFEITTPAVVAMQTGANEPRYATMRMIKDAKKKPLDVVDGASVLDEGRAYSVRRMYVPEASGRAEILEGSPDEVAAKIAEIIREKMGS